jgi:hypothetical protein
MPHQEDVAAMTCERLLTSADSMLNMSVNLIDQARIDDAREQIFRASSALAEAIEILQAFLL